MKKIKNHKKLFIATSFAAILCSFTLLGTFDYLPANADEDVVVSVAAHRGYSSIYPENTLSSLAGACAIDAEVVEFDVQKTSDDVLVIFHDQTLAKYTGDETTIADHTYAELMEFDVGAWLSPDFACERIPTLDQALDLLNSSSSTLFVELKKIENDEDFASQVYATCESHGMLDRIIFSSFDYDYLTEIKGLDENQPVMVLASFGKTSLPEKYPAEYYGINMKTLTTKTIKAIHESGAKVYSYTPETLAQILSLQRMGVDGIITDDPTVIDLSTY